MIVVKNLKKSFGLAEQKVEVLKGVNLEISSSESVALVGKSGSGKSTLLSLLAGLDRPDEGDVFINGVNLTTLNEKALTAFRARNIGFVFQQFHLVTTLTALENILLPLEILKENHALTRAEKLLHSVGLDHRSDHLPSALSGGECQRVAIARALSTNPSILFADEPSGNLDEETGEKIMDLLFEMCAESKTTLVLVTHDLTLAKRCSRVIHLEHGSLG